MYYYGVARDVNSKSLMYKLMQYLRAQIGVLTVFKYLSKLGT